jgi:hypothetical protein
MEIIGFSNMFWSKCWPKPIPKCQLWWFSELLVLAKILEEKNPEDLT